MYLNKVDSAIKLFKFTKINLQLIFIYGIMYTDEEISYNKKGYV